MMGCRFKDKQWQAMAPRPTKRSCFDISIILMYCPSFYGPYQLPPCELNTPCHHMLSWQMNYDFQGWYQGGSLRGWNHIVTRYRTTGKYSNETGFTWLIQARNQHTIAHVLYSRSAQEQRASNTTFRWNKGHHLATLHVREVWLLNVWRSCRLDLSTYNWKCPGFQDWTESHPNPMHVKYSIFITPVVNDCHCSIGLALQNRWYISTGRVAWFKVCHLHILTMVRAHQTW